MQLEPGCGTHLTQHQLCRKTPQGNVPRTSFQTTPNIPIFKLVLPFLTRKRSRVWCHLVRWQTTRISFPYGFFSSLWHNQNGSCMQKCGQDALKIVYLINFSWMRLQIPSLTCDIHRSKARAVVTPALFCRSRSCCGQCVAVCALTELRFAGQVLKPEPGVPKAL